MIELVLPRYVLPKRLKSGATGFYWTCPKVYVDAGCPWRSAPLGENLSQSDLNEAAELWNSRLDEWRTEIARPEPTDRPLEEHFAYGTVGWLLDHYLTTDAFKERVSEPSRPDYKRIFKRVCAVTSKKTKKRCADYRVAEFGVSAAEAIYANFADSGAMRSAEKVVIYCESAWDRMRPHFPTLFRPEVPNPWNGVTVRRREKAKKGFADRERTYKFAWGAVEKGKPELGAAAVLAYEWFMRPSSISAGFAQWTNYRSAANPTKIKIKHRKNGGEVDHPLEAVVDGQVVKLYADAEAILAKVPRRGLSIVTKPDGQLFGDTTLLPKAIREMAEDLSMNGFTLDQARHGGMTEIEEAELTEGQGKALSTHRSKAYRVYAKETEKRVLDATLKRFGHSEGPEKDKEIKVRKQQ
ncbi:hypothetical protein MesoLjLc_51980 [Mesorhizobium sp. L-8-10]|uniref:hypothetical protein n=1 Tax=Mesorhizobium sp. L-8-10 TaxID=2744523 RepID=UPI00192925AA|nr:hypothetical protein [Mesorhizobium sp. L-8-10]BCH33268.1 hypothetical protein MesoLjLc_51980 [Mesorhizobium sp. L-8-10]